MIVQSIDSELWWLANADEIRSPRGVPTPDVTKVLTETFQFFGVPTTISASGYTFQQGSYESGPNKIAITQLILYQSAIHLMVAGSSDGADKVFEKLVEIFEGFGVRRPTTSPVSFYRSSVVCDFDKAASPLFGRLEDISRVVQAAFEVPGAEMQASGIAFVSEPEKLPRALATYNPTLFSINRKTDVEFAKNRCTCFANLPTGTHLAVLAEIEKLL